MTFMIDFMIGSESDSVNAHVHYSPYILSDRFRTRHGSNLLSVMVNQSRL